MLRNKPQFTIGLQQEQQERVCSVNSPLPFSDHVNVIFFLSSAYR